MMLLAGAVPVETLAGRRMFADYAVAKQGQLPNGFAAAGGWRSAASIRAPLQIDENRPGFFSRSAGQTFSCGALN
jgi:hypothetical protein